MKGGGVYVYRTRKPASLIGRLNIPDYAAAAAAAGTSLALVPTDIPWWFGLACLLLSGRHFAYVGETFSFKDRHGEHIDGGGRYGKAAQPWADLSPRVAFRIPLPRWKPLLRAVETLLIMVLAPAYNHAKNGWNPRRIPLSAAKRQRAFRDRTRLGLSPNARPAHGATVALLVVAAVTSWLR